MTEDERVLRQDDEAPGACGSTCIVLLVEGMALLLVLGVILVLVVR